MTHVELFGQPIVSSSLDGTLLGTEVLFRVGADGQSGAIPPQSYLAAMAGGQMAWFMDATVMGILMVGDTRDISEKLFINVCPETLMLPYAFSAWLAGISELCLRRGHGQVVVEMPEHLPYTPRMIALVRAIAAKGALLALDDYPGGNLDSRYLHAYQWDYIKVCKSACATTGRDLSTVVQEIRRYCPSAQIIGERYTPGQPDLEPVIHHIAGLQSFETGMPAPLQVSGRPFEPRTQAFACGATPLLAAV